MKQPNHQPKYNKIYLLLLEMETEASSSVVAGVREWRNPLKKSNYSRERYEKNKDEILKNRREKYRKQTNKELIDIKVMRGTFTLYFN
jgi:predicted phosphohydrolase